MNVLRRDVSPGELAETVRDWVKTPGRRLGHMTGRVDRLGRTVLEALLLDTNAGSGLVVSAQLAEGETEYPSVTRLVPAAHWAERLIGDCFGVRATGHPRWKSLILHDPTWPSDLFPLAPSMVGKREPYTFRRVDGEGIHEIPVGPIHAGIIEPGHFRFSCAGELIAYLEIRLGYLHRGVEKRLTEVPWQQARFVAESASSDTAVGNALAHAVAVESLLGIESPPRAKVLQTIALEIERVANHIGDLGALSGDIGFSPGASLFAPLRAATLGLGALVAGSRFQRYFIRPGGVERDLSPGSHERLRSGLQAIRARIDELVPLVFENAGVLDRMEGTGHVSAAQRRDFGLVGPAARASGSRYDARRCFAHGVFPAYAPESARGETGDVLARGKIRAQELATSLDLLDRLVAELPEGPICADVERRGLMPNAVGVGIVEAWRGELIHWITTDADGAIERYAIRDPSFSNWTALALAVRGNLVADFPLCNKSFNLSYSGNDL